MKNILTNVVGVLLLFTGVYGLLFLDLDLIKFIALALISGILIYFENKTIKSILKKGVKKYLSWNTYLFI